MRFGNRIIDFYNHFNKPVVDVSSSDSAFIPLFYLIEVQEPIKTAKKDIRAIK